MEKFLTTFVAAFIAFAVWDIIKAVAHRRSGNNRDV